MEAQPFVDVYFSSPLACDAIGAQNGGVFLARLVTFAPFHRELEACSHVVDSAKDLSW